MDSVQWAVCVRCTYCALSTRAHLLLTFIDFAQVAKIWNEGRQNPARTPDSRADLFLISYINVGSMPWTICVRCTHCALSTRAHLLLTFIDFAQDAKIWNEGRQNPARTPNSRADLLLLLSYQRGQYAVDSMRTLHVLRTKYTCASATHFH